MTATKTKPRTHLCARCGRKTTADRLIYSRFTRNHYCRHIDDCARRARKTSNR